MTEQQGAGDKHRKSPVKRGGEGRSSSAWSSTLGTDLPGISLWVTYRESGCLVWVLTFSPGFSLHPVAVLVHGPRQDEAVISRCVRLGEGQARDAVVGGAAVTPRSPGRSYWDDPACDSTRGGLSALPYLPPASTSLQPLRTREGLSAGHCGP